MSDRRALTTVVLLGAVVVACSSRPAAPPTAAFVVEGRAQASGAPIVPPFVVHGPPVDSIEDDAVRVPVVLDDWSGNWELAWDTGECSPVTAGIDLIHADALPTPIGGVEAPSEAVRWDPFSDDSTRRYRGLDPGRYAIEVAFSKCPWEVTLSRWTPPTVSTLPVVMSGEASPDGQPTTRYVTLDDGLYTLTWSAGEPDASTECGITIAMFDSAGDYAGGSDWVSLSMHRLLLPQHGTEDVYLPAGRYQLFVYVGCPWEVTLDKTG